jgi:hypothetical protein
MKMQGKFLPPRTPRIGRMTKQFAAGEMPAQAAPPLFSSLALARYRSNTDTTR